MGRASSLCFALRLDITHNKQTQPRRARHETQPTTNREQAAQLRRGSKWVSTPNPDATKPPNNTVAYVAVNK